MNSCHGYSREKVSFICVIGKILKTDNEEHAKKILQNYQVSREQHSQKDAILKLFKAKRKYDIKLNRCLIADVWKAAEELPPPRKLSSFTVNTLPAFLLLAEYAVNIFVYNSLPEKFRPS